MPFRGSERGGGQKASSVEHVRRQGGATTGYRGTTARDPRSTMAAYQYNVRTGTGSSRKLLNNQGRVIGGGGGGIRARASRRRPGQAYNPQAENKNYFEDRLMKRFGGDASLRNRLIGMYNEFGGKANPTGAVDWYEAWSEDPYKGNMYRPGEYEWAKQRGAEFRAGEQANALDDWSGGGTGVPPRTVSQGFI
jgi:hypothetical protein